MLGWQPVRERERRLAEAVERRTARHQPAVAPGEQDPLAALLRQALEPPHPEEAQQPAELAELGRPQLGAEELEEGIRSAELGGPRMEGVADRVERPPLARPEGSHTASLRRTLGSFDEKGGSTHISLIWV